MNNIHASEGKSTFIPQQGVNALVSSGQTTSTYLFMLHFKEECIESRNNTELKYGVVYLLNDSLKNNTVSHRIQYNLEFSLM